MNPTDEFNKAVESALHNSWSSVKSRAKTAEALASIQAATAKLLEGLVGEDEPIIQWRYSRSDQQVKSEVAGADALLQELRQKIDQLIKDLSNE